jgi:hypothetical protein
LTPESIAVRSTPQGAKAGWPFRAAAGDIANAEAVANSSSFFITESPPENLAGR